MSKRSLAVVAVAAAAVLMAPATATATATAAAPAHQLKLRNGLTLYLPMKWRIHGGGTDWIHVVTGKCAHPEGGFFTTDCKGFWILGPKAIKLGAEGFGPYNVDRGGYYPASDVQRCPVDGKLLRVEKIGPHKKGLRQVGPGHKAAYHEFQTRCRTHSGKITSTRFTTREWYLPKTKILVVDTWKTPGLATALRNADWN
ncbi:hypothetical protein ACTMTF_30850 [Nonomuraea sp. ZG12]|uniref:hypothetical protein n=1 Tax=Nonomuraea sp. ZG12 TaxID=3452207 RepID=UPI003F8A8EC1